MEIRNHIVITGTGRCGTTFLVELYTALGLDTGFAMDDLRGDKYYEGARAGLERDIRRDHCPRVVKSPHFCDLAAEIVQREDVHIEHVLVPMRDLQAAAESRRFVTESHAEQLSGTQKLKQKLKPKSVPGGLWQTKSGEAGEQELVLLNVFYRLILSLTETSVPITFMKYPRIVKDGPYLYGKLRPTLDGMSEAQFMEAFNRVANPDLVHTFNENDR